MTPPTLGPPASYIHVIWLAAFPGDVHEYYDELDAGRWSIRCVWVKTKATFRLPTTDRCG
jgi:hypothetical protein